MQRFNYKEEVAEWLELLDYDEFWKEVEALDLMLPERRACDADIRNGCATQALVLDGLKEMARVQIVLDQALRTRHHMPEMLLH